MYFDIDAKIKQDNHTITVIVPHTVETDKELFKAYSDQLFFPDWFGNNWDALQDCLYDLSWVKEKTITIIHQDLPLKDNSHEMSIYLEILCTTEKHWLIEKDHIITIYFPERFKETIKITLKI